MLIYRIRILVVILFLRCVVVVTYLFIPPLKLISPSVLITIMAALTAVLSDESKNGTISSIPTPSLKSNTLMSKVLSKELRTDNSKPQQSNLTQKITSLNTSNDPFKNLYRAEWRAHTAVDEKLAPTEYKSTNGGPSTTSPVSIDFKSDGNKELSCLNGKFQNITLQRVLALRKVQHAIQSAPNASAVGADSTTFSEDDLQCLTMEELQALQKRKRAIHKEIQPLSVVKVSIQAERSRKRLEPRDYQMELYERARRENTIAVLGTGTGKTLIACLLIKDILVQERVNRAAEMKVIL